MSISALETGLYSKLSTHSGLTTALGGTIIYNKQAPQGTTGPYVVFNWQGGGPDNDTQHNTYNELYAVQAVASTQGTAAAIAAQIDSALHKQTLTVSGYTNFWTVKEQHLNYVEQDSSGVTHYHVGAIFRVRLGD